MITTKLTSISILLLYIIILASCTQQDTCPTPQKLIGGFCCFDSNSDGVCDGNIPQEVEKSSDNAASETPIVIKESQGQSNTSSQNEPGIDSSMATSDSHQLPSRTFTIKELETFIDELDGNKNTFDIDSLNTPFVLKMKNDNITLIRANSQYKNWALIDLSNSTIRMQSINDFQKYVNIPSWDGWRYYINETNWEYVHPLMTEKELNKKMPEYPYSEYTKDTESNLILYNVVESPIKTQTGTIIEYKMETVIVNRNNKWRGNWESPVLVYKIPCTQDLIIIYRPRWSISFGNFAPIQQTKEETDTTWLKEVEMQQRKAINVSDKIMNYCHVTTSMFDNVKFQNYEKHTRVVNNWQEVYHDLNHSATATLSVDPILPDKTTYKFKQINATFTSFSNGQFPQDRYAEDVSVKIIIDNHGRTKEIYDDIFFSGKLPSGKEEKRSFSPDYKEPLQKDTTISVHFYFGTNKDAEFERYYVGDPVVIPITNDN